MGNVILFLITMGIIALIIYFIYKATNKNNTPAETISYFVLAIISIIFIGIYYLDRFNVPTELGWGINVNTQNWLSFIGTYVTGIIGAGIGVIASVFITIYQIKKNNEENNNRDKENLRIQNMPIIKYYLTTHELMVPKPQEIKTKFNNDNKYNISIKLKNIGLNIIKSIKVDFDSEINNKIIRLEGKNTQISVEKDEEIPPIKRCFNLEHAEKPYKMNLIVYYEDVLNNWYKQTVEIDYIATGNATVGGYTGKINYIINKEELIEEKEIPCQPNHNDI